MNGRHSEENRPENLALAITAAIDPRRPAARNNGSLKRANSAAPSANSATRTGHKLSIVIPALNEEEAIGTTIERCLDARGFIVENSGVTAVEIIVVSDGSSDRTEEIARSYDDVTVLAFAQNRGYGAALMCGFEHASGDLLSFLDADGTCDPKTFAELCRAIDAPGADVVLGSRMGPESEMPRLRAVGNTLFAWILRAASEHHVDDTASGMRVIRRDCLPDLYPLPTGMHFTPAMTARVLLEGTLKLVEIPMPYRERIGRSKLSVLRDGIRFLTVILQAAVTYRPARPILFATAVLALLGAVLGIHPVLSYLRTGHLEEWMIYRILSSSGLTTLVAVLVCTAVVADRIAETAHYRPTADGGISGLLSRLFTRQSRWIGTAGLLAGALLVAWPGILEYATSGHIDMHWSRAVLATMLLVLAAVLLSTTFLLNMLDLIRLQRAEKPAERPPDRIRPRVVHRPMRSTSRIPKIFVTGSSGLIGSEMVTYFGARADRIVGTDNNMRADFFGPEGDTRWNLQRLKKQLPNFRPYDADVRDRTALTDLFRNEGPFDLIVHCAAQPSHDLAAKRAIDDFEVNATGTMNLLDATRNHSPEAVFVHMSTNKVYGDAPNELPLTELPRRWDYARAEDFDGIDETLRIDSSKHSLFGVSKVAADVMVQEYGRYFGMRTVCLRCGCLTGPNHSGVELHGFLSYLVKAQMQHSTYRIYGYKGKQVRDNIHSHDVAAAVEAIYHDPGMGEVFNLGGGRENSCSILEAFDRVEQLAGKRMDYEYVDEPRAGDHICYISNLSRFRARYPGWMINRSLDDILVEIIDAWRTRLAR